MFAHASSVATGNSGRNWIAAFIAGFLAVLLLHQPTLALLATLKITQATPYSMKPVAPFGVPQFLSAAFWGGLWGLVFYFFSRRWRHDASYSVKAFLFGLILLPLVAWFVVAPLKGLPLAAGGKPNSMLTTLCTNGAWGLGTGFLLRLFSRWIKA
jgi:hypothetical protein